MAAGVRYKGGTTPAKSLRRAVAAEETKQNNGAID